MRMLNAAQAASQPIPQFLCLNYDQLFKIQRVHNPFSLGPVSYSRLASYLQCPWCTLAQKRKRRPKEPAQFTEVHQSSLFGTGRPDPRMVGTLLHTLVNFLHDNSGPLSEAQRSVLLTDSGRLTRFIRQDALLTLQQAGKINLAMFFNELNFDARTLYTVVIDPLLRYQRELISTNTVIFAAAERFQCKLLSTGNTFAEYPDRGGYIGLIGEFDQIRLRNVDTNREHSGTPAIIEFKKGLGASVPSIGRAEDNEENGTGETDPQPTYLHAMQLMVYWIAFQTRWDIGDVIQNTKGMLRDVHMPLHQPLELIIYNLNDGCQYQLCPTSHKESLLALIECIFYLDWAMKSGYVWQAPEHGCQRAAPLTAVPDHTIQIQVGYKTISAQECYLLARAAFDRFKDTVRWKKLSAMQDNE